MKLNSSIDSLEQRESVHEGGSNNKFRNVVATDSRRPGSRGHSAAFEEIWRAHAKQILRVTLRITRNREDAEDALQDSFLKAYVHLHSFDGRSSLATWLTRIAINSALLILRKRASAPQLSIDSAGDSEAEARGINAVDRDSDPEERYAQTERRALLQSGLRTLRPSIRRAIEIRTIEDHSIKEAADKMGLSVSATKSRIFHAKAALRKSLVPASAPPRPVERIQFSPA